MTVTFSLLSYVMQYIFMLYFVISCTYIRFNTFQCYPHNLKFFGTSMGQYIVDAPFPPFLGKEERLHKAKGVKDQKRPLCLIKMKSGVSWASI